MNIFTRTVIGLMAAVIATLILVGAGTIPTVRSTVLELVQDESEQLTRLLHDLAELSARDAQQLVSSGGWLVNRAIAPGLSPGDGLRSVPAVNQESGAEVRIVVPDMLWDGQRAADRVAELDQIRAETLVDVTIFQRIDRGYLRVATTIQNASGQRAVGTYIPSDSPVATALDSGQVYQGRADVLGQRYLTVYHPVSAADGTVIGAVFAGVPQVDAEYLREEIVGVRVGESGYAFVMDSDGLLIFHPFLEGQNVSDRDYIQQMLQLGDGSVTHQETQEDGSVRTRDVFFQTVDSVGWTVALATYRDETLSASRQISLLILGIFAVALLAALIIGWFLARSIANPVRRLAGELSGLASREADLTVRLPDAARDETGQMARSFNAFIAQLENLISTLKDAIARSSEVKATVASATEETTTAIEQIGATIVSIGTRMRTLDDEVGGTTAALQQISHNTETVDEQIAAQASMVEQQTAAVTQMIAALNNVDRVASARADLARSLAAVATDGETRVRETEERFATVEREVQRIREMASAINDIASRTNLLSMNAAIEAAHAGEQGKGFAVVAEEIRKLADSAGQSTRQIAASVKDVTEAVASTGATVRTTAEAFRQISAEVNAVVGAFTEIQYSVSELNEGSKQVLEATTEVNNTTVAIRDGSREIRTGSESILGSAERVAGVSSEVRNGMDEVTSGVSEIVQAMQDVSAQTQTLSGIVDELTQLFGSLKTG